MAGCVPEDPVTLSQVNVSILNCPICLETYKMPRVLSCVHTFCEECLLSYVQEQVEKGAWKTIPCPLCGKETSFPDPSKPVGDWVKTLPLNHTILQALISSSGEYESKKCEPCSVIEQTKEATSVCQDCGEYHCEECLGQHARFALMKGHKAWNLQEAPEQNLLPMKLGKLVFCQEHNDKMIEFCCRDHGALCCSSCLFLGHRGCQTVVEVTELGMDMKDGKEPDKLMKRLTSLQDELRDISTKLEANVTDIGTQAGTLPSKLKDFSTKVVHALDELVKTVSADSVQIKNERQRLLNEKIIKCRSLIAAINSSCTLLESVVERGTETQICILFHRLEEQFRQYQKMVLDINTNTCTVELCLDLDQVLHELMTSRESLAKISVIETGLIPEPRLVDPAPGSKPHKVTVIPLGETEKGIEQQMQEQITATPAVNEQKAKKKKGRCMLL